jgi:hypothetical protein
MENIPGQAVACSELKRLKYPAKNNNIAPNTEKYGHLCRKFRLGEEFQYFVVNLEHIGNVVQNA